MDPLPTPDFVEWLRVYWPILGGLVTTAAIAAVTLRDVRQIKLWLLHHRHDEDGAVVITLRDGLGR